MEALLFFALITAAISLLGYFMRRTSASKKTELARKQKQIYAASNHQAERLATAGHNLLANRDEVWRTRRQHVSLVNESAEKTLGQKYFAYKPGEEPEYDGYSRSERHHITPRQIRKEGHAEDIHGPGGSGGYSKAT